MPLNTYTGICTYIGLYLQAQRVTMNHLYSDLIAVLAFGLVVSRRNFMSEPTASLLQVYTYITKAASQLILLLPLLLFFSCPISQPSSTHLIARYAATGSHVAGYPCVWVLVCIQFVFLVWCSPSTPPPPLELH